MTPKDKENQKKLPATTSNIGLSKLIESRNAELTLELFFEGRLDLEDLNSKELKIYERVVWLMAYIKGLGKERFTGSDLLERHMEEFSISIATANRDLKIVSKRRKQLTESELEFQRYYLYQRALDALDLAETDAFSGAGARGMASAINAAIEALGFKGRDKNKGEVDVTKIEQHINILVTDEMTSKIFRQLLQNNVSVLKHNTELDEILRLEKESIEKSQNITPIDYEELGTEITEE